MFCRFVSFSIKLNSAINLLKGLSENSQKASLPLWVDMCITEEDFFLYTFTLTIVLLRYEQRGRKICLANPKPYVLPIQRSLDFPMPPTF